MATVSSCSDVTLAQNQRLSLLARLGTPVEIRQLKPCRVFPGGDNDSRTGPPMQTHGVVPEGLQKSQGLLSLCV